MRRLRRLVQKRSVRWSEGVAVLEGPDLLDAALASDQDVEAIFLDGATEPDERVASMMTTARSKGVPVFTLAPGVLARVADAKTPQPVLATYHFRPLDLDALRADGVVIVLDEVRDPGNAGTVIRSAEAAGAAAVVFSGSTVDPYNPKTLRATAGAIFHVPVVVAPLAAVVDVMRARGAKVWAAVVRDGVALESVDLSGPVAVVVGNESEGLDQASVELCDGRVSINMVGRSESLNLGVAASLIAFEALQQRQGTERQSPRPSLGGL